MSCSCSYLQVNFYKRFDGAVSITVVLKESETMLKVGVRAAVKPFFIFYFLLSQRSRKFFAIYMFAEKSMFFFMFYAHVKRLHSVKWRGLYGDTATIENVYKFCMEEKKSEIKCH